MNTRHICLQVHLLGDCVQKQRSTKELLEPKLNIYRQYYMNIHSPKIIASFISLIKPFIS